MIDSYFRTAYQRYFIDPITAKLCTTSVSPNTLTACALFSGLAILPMLYLGYNILALALLLCSGYCDTLDGSLARLLKRSTPLGAAFDIISDRVVEFIIILSLYLVDPEMRALYCLSMLGSVMLCVTSFLVVGVFTHNTSQKSFHYSPGLIERSEAFLFFALMIALPAYFSLLAILFSALVSITTLIRISEFQRNALQAHH